MLRRLAICLSGFVLANANLLSTLAAPPTLTHLYPAGGQRGSRFITTCKGEFEWPVAIWAPGVQARPLAESGQIEVTIPEDLAADRIWLRLYNSAGTSQSQPLMIGSLEETNEQEPNNHPRQAQPLSTSRMTVNGVLQENGDVDGYAVHLSAGETLVTSVDANTALGSPMDAILQLVRPDGFVLAENHDDRGLDPALVYTASTEGTYVVRLFAFPSEPDTTIAFRGGSNYVYRLTITTGPFLRRTDPLTIASLSPPDSLLPDSMVKPLGWNLFDSTPLAARSWDARLRGFEEWEPFGDQRLSPDDHWAIVYDRAIAGTARVRVTPQRTQMARTSGTSDTPTSLAANSTITGHLIHPRQIDHYRLPLRTGQTVIVSAEGPSLHSPVMPKVEWLDPAGKVVAEVNEASGPGDALLSHSVNQDGDFLLRVSDRFRQSGDDYFYRLSVRVEQPDFELGLPAESIVVPPDKPATIDVTVKRRTSSMGPIRLEVTGLPAGFTAPAVISEATGPTAEKVTLTINGNGRAFSGPIRIRGVADYPIPRLRYARTPARLNTCFSFVWLTAQTAVHQ